MAGGAKPAGVLAFIPAGLFDPAHGLCRDKQLWRA
jgi:hypothetical protein